MLYLYWKRVVQQAQRFGKSGGSVLRMTVYRKFEVCASYESSVVKSPPSPSRKTLAASITDTTQDFLTA